MEKLNLHHKSAQKPREGQDNAGTVIYTKQTVTNNLGRSRGPVGKPSSFISRATLPSGKESKNKEI